MRLSREKLREIAFRVSVVLKGLNAALEVVGGVALAVASPGFVAHLAALLTQHELAQDPDDLLANYLLRSATHLTVSGKLFVAVYLLAHGVIKLGLVWALLERKLWAYPLSMLVFGAFIVYQIYRFTLTHGLGLVALSVFDVLLIGLIYLEYRALKRHRVP